MLLRALQDSTTAGYDPEFAKVIAQVADGQADWDLGPVCALWITTRDACSVG